MGTDVHAVAQVRSPGETWRDVPINWKQGRHYFLFAWLADVRNGRGFAGIVTGDPIEPIAEPRGLPDDFEVIDDIHPTDWNNVKERYRATWRDGKPIPEGEEPEYYVTAEDWEKDAEDEGEVKGLWMGDHSHSWLTADEILDPEKRPSAHVHEGIVARDVYVAWKVSGDVNPQGWAGGVSGAGIKIVDEPEEGFQIGAFGESNIPSEATHLRCRWTDEDDGLQYFVDAVQELVNNHPGHEVRIVFGFDS